MKFVRVKFPQMDRCHNFARGSQGSVIFSNSELATQQAWGADVLDEMVIAVPIIMGYLHGISVSRLL